MASFTSATRRHLKASSGVSGLTVSVFSLASPSCSSRIKASPSSRNRSSGETRIVSASSSACSRRQPLTRVRISVRLPGARRSMYDVVIRFPASSNMKPSLIQSNSLFMLSLTLTGALTSRLSLYETYRGGHRGSHAIGAARTLLTTASGSGPLGVVSLLSYIEPTGVSRATVGPTFRTHLSQRTDTSRLQLSCWGPGSDRFLDQVPRPLNQRHPQ